MIELAPPFRAVDTAVSACTPDVTTVKSFAACLIVSAFVLFASLMLLPDRIARSRMSVLLAMVRSAFARMVSAVLSVFVTSVPASLSALAYMVASVSITLALWVFAGRTALWYATSADCLPFFMTLLKLSRYHAVSASM